MDGQKIERVNNGGCHPVISPGPHISPHATRGGRSNVDRGDGEQDADDEEAGDDAGASDGHLPLTIDKSDNQRNARQVAG